MSWPEQKCRPAFAQVIGGKGGGKPGQAQGQGPDVDSIDDAVRAALEFAALKLD
jgi:alanyl-tRNA synthetase